MTRRWVLAAMVLAVFASGAAPAGAATLLPGFADEVVTTVGAPTAFGFTADGRMLITTQPGRLRVLSGGTLLATPALDLSASTCSDSERGAPQRRPRSAQPNHGHARGTWVAVRATHPPNAAVTQTNLPARGTWVAVCATQVPSAPQPRCVSASGPSRLRSAAADRRRHAEPQRPVPMRSAKKYKRCHGA